MSHLLLLQVLTARFLLRHHGHRTQVGVCKGSIGSEDTWIRSEEGMRAVTAHDAWPWFEW